MDPVAEFGDANEIARRILSKQRVSDEEFRYAVMFNLTAMTQLLWELSNSEGSSRGGKRLGHDESDTAKVQTSVKSTALKLAPIAAIVAFLAGLGLGVLMP